MSRPYRIAFVATTIVGLAWVCDWAGVFAAGLKHLRETARNVEEWVEDEDEEEAVDPDAPDRAGA